MPSFTAQVPNLQQTGPVCSVRVGISTTTEKILSKLEQPVPSPLEVTALIDTGASRTCVNPAVAKALRLIPRGVADIATPSSKAHPCNVYDVSLHFTTGWEAWKPSKSLIKPRFLL